MGVSDKRSLFAVIAGGIGLFLASGNAGAEMSLNLTRGVTPSSEEIYGLHMLIFWICVGIGVLVYGVMAWTIYHHRKSKGVQASQFHEHTTLEVVWTVIPFLILITIAVPATSTMIRLYDTSEADLTVKVTGYQWRWQYDYVDHDINFMSSLATPFDQIENRAPKGENYLLEVDNPLVLPINKKVRFVITANDVIHAWWVPALGFKQDAIPGFINEAWANIKEPGVYRGQCAELCGRGHAYMPIVVEAKTEEDFEKWVAERKVALAGDAEAAEETWSLEDLMEKGEQVYNTACVACHQANGQGVPGTFPAIAGSEVVRGPVDKHLDAIVKGSPDATPPMPPMGSQLSDIELAAVATYERNAFGNDTGDVIQPSQIKAAR
jgi:cytochrome c oxidase subunit II